MKRNILLNNPAIIVLLAALGACNADKPPEGLTAEAALPLTLENIYKNQSRVRQAALSPDGTVLAVSVGGTIYTVDIQSGDAEQLVQGSSPIWSPDGSRIAFSRSGDLWLLFTDEGEPRQLTEAMPGTRAAAFSPDGRWIAFYSIKGGHQDIYLTETDVSNEPSPPRQLTFEAVPEDDGRFTPAWSPNGRYIAYVSCKDDYSSDDIWLVEVSTGKAEQLSRTIMATSTPVWSPDGTKLALQATAKDEYWYEDLCSIYLLDPAAGSELRVEMQVYATDAGNRHKVYWSADGRQLYFLYTERGNGNLWTVPSSGGVATRITNMEGAMSSFDVSAHAEVFSILRSTPTRGSEVYTMAARGGSIRRITQFATQWQDVRAPEEIAFESFDGMYIQGFLYRPAEFDPGNRYPALVQVHGGGTNSYLNGLNLSEQYLASRGYVVLAVNYRGGSGFGREFQDLSIGDWANGQARDAGAAADFLRGLPFCSGKVGIYGYSYGGIMTMATVARVPGKFDAAVPMAGIYDFADAQRTADRVGKIFVQTGHLGTPEENPEAYEISNTMARIKNIDTPLLIMHGEHDVRAPFRQYEMAVAELRKHGKEFESKSYPNEPHGFRNPDNRIDLYRRLEQFFDQRLK
jgi:dipeptidyl aminopeptidase/acylaminoacyl peptidase